MASWKALLLGGGLALGGAGLGLYWQQAESEPPAPEAPAAQPAAEQDVPSTPAKPPTPAKRQQLLAAPQVQQHQRRLEFHNGFRAFIASAASLDASERESQAAALAKQIDEYETRGELALSEALLLQTALIQATVADEAEQKSRAEALAARYKAISAAREAERDKTQPQAFTRYKQDERRIVEEVMAMEHIPGGLSRDQYLRQRLQEAREQAYQ
jgi:hypothetical protein